MARSLLLLVLLVAAAGCSPKSVLERLQPGGSGALRQGIERFNDGNVEEARRLLLKAVEEDPSDPNAQLYMGLAHLKAREVQKARARLERALELDPKNERTLFYLSELARKRKDFAAAESHLLEALAISPDNFAILNNLGLVGCEQKKYRKAIGYYTKALEQNRTSFVTFYNLGEAYRKSEQYSNAVRVFTEAQALAKDNLYLAFSLAETYFFLKKYEDSINQYTRILASPKRFDQLGRVYFQLGVIHYLQEKTTDALGYFEMAAQTSYDRVLVDVWRAKVQIRLSQFSEALRLLKRATESRSRGSRGNPAQIQYYRGISLMNLGRAEEAIPCFKSALLFDLPRDRVFAQLGAAYLKKALGMPSTVAAEALDLALSNSQEAFEKCLAIDQQNLVALLGLAQVEFIRQDFSSALDRTRAVLAVEKDFLPAMLQQSLCHYRLKQPPEAIGQLEACLIVEPSNTNVMFFLAQIYAQGGRFADAEALFQRGLSIEPRNLDAMLLLSSVFAKTGRYRDAAIMLERILDGEGELEVKQEARELYAIVSDTYKQVVDQQKSGVKGKLGTAAYVEQRLAKPMKLIEKSRRERLNPDERATLQELIDRLVLDHNYVSQNSLFESQEVADRYATALREMVAVLRDL